MREATKLRLSTNEDGTGRLDAVEEWRHGRTTRGETEDGEAINKDPRSASPSLRYTVPVARPRAGNPTGRQSSQYQFSGAVAFSSRPFEKRKRKN